MNLKHYSQDKLKKEILGIIGGYLDLSIYKVFFFGSRAKRTNSETSDVDIGIEGPKPVLLAILAKIQEEIDNLPFLYKVDVVDFNNASVPDAFRKIALRDIERVN